MDADPGGSARRIRRWAIVACAAHVALAILSYGLAPFAPMQEHHAERLQLLAEVASYVPWAESLGVNAYMRGEGLLEDVAIRALAYLAPLAVATTAALAVLAIILRGRAADSHVLALLQRSAFAFAAINIVRYPVCTNDLWLSVAWGRMAAEGINPYYNDFTSTSLQGLPFPFFALHTTYGPLWTAVSWLVASLARHSVLAEYLLLKLVLAGSWLVMVIAVRRATERRSTQRAAVALCLVGWLPASVMLTVGEGHNDAPVAAGIALFLWWGATGRSTGSWLALAASVLVKYVTAPLAVLGIVRTFVGQPEQRHALGVSLLVSGLVVVACLAVFWRGPGFFDGTLSMRSWNFLTPATATHYFLEHLGILAPGAATLDTLFTVLFLGFVISATVRYLRSPDEDAFAYLTLAVLAFVVLALLDHVWPWFTLWILPPAALAARTGLGRWTLALIACVPILDMAWFLADDWSLLEPLGAVAFGAATALALAQAFSRMHLRRETA